MNCPKCLREFHALCEICPHCGIVFAKYFKYHPEQPDQRGDQPPIVARVEEAEDGTLTQYLFYETPQSTPAKLLGRSIIFAGLLVWSVQLLSGPIESNMSGNTC